MCIRESDPSPRLSIELQAGPAKHLLASVAVVIIHGTMLSDVLGWTPRVKDPLSLCRNNRDVSGPKL